MKLERAEFFHIDNAMFLSNNYSDDVWKMR